MNHPIDTRKRRIGFSAIPVVLLLLGSALFFYASDRTEGAQTPAGVSSSVRAAAENGAERQAPPATVRKVMIDPGHGGHDPGTTGVDGHEERDVNLSIALKLYEILQADPRFDVRLTRSDDTFVELEDRSAMANEWPADALLSIHGNSFTDESVSGTETYYEHENGMPLAQAVHDAVVETMGFKDRGVRENQLQVLSLSEVPSALVEVGYLTNAGQEAALRSEEGGRRAAQAIAEGLKRYFGLSGEDVDGNGNDPR